MTSMAAVSRVRDALRKLTGGPRGFSVYVLGGKDAADGNKLTKPRSHDREPRPYVDDPSMMQHGPNSYPFPANGTAYGPSSFPPSAPYNYSYGTPGGTPYGAPYAPSDAAFNRPSLRRGEPFDDVFDPGYSSDEIEPHVYDSADYARSRRPSLSRSGSSHGSRGSGTWDMRYPDQQPSSRPVPIRGDSNASRGEYGPGMHGSAVMQHLSEGFGAQYQYPDHRSSPPMSLFGSSPGSPGSLASSDSDFSMPRTPPPMLPPIQIPQVATPGSRSVRWDDNLIAPSPIFAVRRKGWYCRRGDQLWTNGGAYRPPKAGDEYPIDLLDYPDFGEGWMNEEGVRIDMQHCLVPKTPRRSALKRRES